MEVIALAIALYPASGQPMGHQHLTYQLTKVNATTMKSNEESDGTNAHFAVQQPLVALQITLSRCVRY